MSSLTKQDSLENTLNNYGEVLDYLYSMLPMFHRIGPKAFKKDLTNTLALCAALGNPQDKFKSIHIAGTNGKGSVSHMLASVFQASGYKTGLYTSPHLVDFRERIRLNGQMAPEDFVVRFVKDNRQIIEEIQPSFFEVTVAMAFKYFADSGVDIAIIETGLGGRLDSTNVINPLLSIITNVSFDHQDMLGQTLPEIATEKAGIIKKSPVIIGKRQPETESVFREKAEASGASIAFAEDKYSLLAVSEYRGILDLMYLDTDTMQSVGLSCPLAGMYQAENVPAVLLASDMAARLGYKKIKPATISKGIEDVVKNTGLRGRWEILDTEPLTVVDVAHNEAGLQAVFSQVAATRHDKLHIVYGMVRDKAIEKALSSLPRNAAYYFCRPDIPRGLETEILLTEAAKAGLTGEAYPSVKAAYEAARAAASPQDMVLIAGSFFVAAEVLSI